MNIQTGDVAICGGNGPFYEERGNVIVVVLFSSKEAVYLEFDARDNTTEKFVFDVENMPGYCFCRKEWEAHGWKFL